MWDVGLEAVELGREAVEIGRQVVRYGRMVLMGLLKMDWKKHVGELASGIKLRCMIALDICKYGKEMKHLTRWNWKANSLSTVLLPWKLLLWILHEPNQKTALVMVLRGGK